MAHKDVIFNQAHKSDVFDFVDKIRDMSFIDIEQLLVESKIPYIHIRHILMEWSCYGSSKKETWSSV
jgi:hypothetical protein